MLEALIAGERDPRRLADLARGRMKPKQAALVEALTGRFDDHHAELARMLLDQIDALATQIGTLTTRIDELLTAMEPQARADEPDTTAAARARPTVPASRPRSSDSTRSPASARDSRRSSSPRSGWT